MPILILIVAGAWFFWGDPPKTVANWFWEYEAAPWETVDAFYYPNRNNLSKYQKVSGLGSVESCRTAVYSMASNYGDVSLIRGDYECGIEVVGNLGGIDIYRTTTR